MNIIALQKELLDAYSYRNLNAISLTLINLYKNQQFGILQKIADIIGDFISIEISVDGKGFSKLMMLYHPDRMDFHVNEINRLVSENNLNKLLDYSHILRLARIDEIASSLDSYEDIDYSPVYEYEWDDGLMGFHIEYGKKKEDDLLNTRRRKRKELNFYDAVKVRIYGDTHTEYPSYYLEDWDEFELAAADISDLDGIQYCIHTKIFDLSENYISDLTPLESLINIEELNLSDNRINIIDSLGFLKNLRTIILNNNHIDDISPLYLLSKLEYVELSGNDINPSQIDKLRTSGVQVIV